MNFRFSTVVLMIAVVLGCLPHDIYQVGLGIIAAIAFMRVAEQINSRLGRVLIYILTAVTASQLLVLGRRAICEDGLYQTLRNNPVRLIGGDIAYGFKHVIMTIHQSVVASINYWSDESALAQIEGLNPRMVIVGWLIIGISILLVLKPTYKKSKQA